MRLCAIFCIQAWWLFFLRWKIRNRIIRFMFQRYTAILLDFIEWKRKMERETERPIHTDTIQHAFITIYQLNWYPLFGSDHREKTTWNEYFIGFWRKPKSRGWNRNRSIPYVLNGTENGAYRWFGKIHSREAKKKNNTYEKKWTMEEFCLFFFFANRRWFAFAVCGNLINIVQNRSHTHLSMSE